MYSYETVSEAVAGLQKRGFSTDFNLKKNGIAFNDTHLHPHEFEIVEYYRFEGDSDPADEAIVYAIESSTGLKGILVNGYGISSETLTNEMADKLRFHPH
jgi:hypothetical protein